MVQDIARPDVNGVATKMAAIKDLAQAELSAPFILISTDDNLCSSVYIRGAFTTKDAWLYGIFHNAPYFQFLITAPGRYYKEGDKVSVELTSKGQGVNKFRKYTGTPEKVVAKIKEWLETPRT
jgi:hypothetical protein